MNSIFKNQACESKPYSYNIQDIRSNNKATRIQQFKIKIIFLLVTMVTPCRGQHLALSTPQKNILQQHKRYFLSGASPFFYLEIKGPAHHSGKMETLPGGFLVPPSLFFLSLFSFSFLSFLPFLPLSIPLAHFLALS